MSERTVFALESASVGFGGILALDDIDLVVSSGERVALIGPSGAGKTTLLALLNGTLLPTRGRALAFGRDTRSLNRRALRETQSRIGIVRQQFDLVGPLKAVHNVNAGHLARWSFWRAALSLVRPQAVGEARSALARVGIADKLFERTERLSGGQQQRVALARVLVQRPHAILADEPISNLDPALGIEIVELLRELVFDGDRTLVMSIHDYSLALRYCTRVVGLREGTVVFDAAPSEVDDVLISELYRVPAPM